MKEKLFFENFRRRRGNNIQIQISRCETRSKLLFGLELTLVGVNGALIRNPFISSPSFLYFLTFIVKLIHWFLDYTVIFSFQLVF